MEWSFISPLENAFFDLPISGFSSIHNKEESFFLCKHSSFPQHRQLSLRAKRGLCFSFLLHVDCYMRKNFNEAVLYCKTYICSVLVYMQNHGTFSLLDAILNLPTQKYMGVIIHFRMDRNLSIPLNLVVLGNF